MKILQYLAGALVAAGAGQMAHAMNYGSTDLLLVFRLDGQKNVEFNLGSVSNFLSHAPGERFQVPYDSALVQSNFNNSLLGVKFAVVGTTGQSDPLPRVWVTDGTVLVTPAQVTFSKFSQISGKIDSVGVQATIHSASNSAPYVVATSALSSYDYLVTYGALSAVSTFYGDSPTPVGGGLSPLPVDAPNPTTIALYGVQVSGTNPKPAATLVGSFTLDSTGALFFTAEALPPLQPVTISGVNIDVTSTTASVSFLTQTGMNYQLVYASALTGEWLPVPGAVVAGDGTEQTLSDYAAADPVRFYAIQTTY